MHPQLEAYLRALGVDDPEHALEGWTITPGYRDGVEVGVVAIKGPEMHMLAWCDKKAMTRKNILEFMTPVMDLYGYVVTRVPIAEADHKLRRVLGFEYMWADDQFSYWCCTNLPFQKVNK